MATTRWASTLLLAAAVPLGVAALVGVGFDVFARPPDPNPASPGAQVYADAPDGWSCPDPDPDPDPAAPAGTRIVIYRHADTTHRPDTAFAAGRG